jgi:hypothetical protein
MGGRWVEAMADGMHAWWIAGGGAGGRGRRAGALLHTPAAHGVCNDARERRKAAEREGRRLWAWRGRERATHLII